jgi:predicted Ser/Thr protein kinase
MQTQVECPSAERLARYVRNELPTDDASLVERHLADCPTCLTQMFELGRQSPAPEIPGCHFVKEVGRGRFGVVYKAWWTLGQPRIVALKLLACPSEMERSRFEREVTVLKKLDSPAIVKCLDSGTAGEAVYYVMEYVDGVHFDEYLQASAPKLDEKLKLFAEVCRAVAEAHSMGVIHRDLKPRNILIDAEGKPRILDFGICSVDALEWGSTTQQTITHPGDLIGTLRYMSPEQAWGGAAGVIDERSDLWALGVMLYETVTDGDYPYSLEPMPDKTIHEALLERLRKELPNSPKLTNVPRGQDLQVLLSRCLAWELDQRMSSAANLADDLQRYIKGQRIKTKPLSAAYRVKRLAVGAATRSRWTFAAGFIAAIGLALWFSAFCLDVGWRVPGHNYQNQSLAAELLNDSAWSRDTILIAGVSDDTADSVVAFAASHGLQGVTATIRSWRAVHGHLMERLAGVQPRGVVWDFYFQSPQPGDAKLVQGIQRLERGGVPVVLAARTFDENGDPDLSDGITRPLGRTLRCGAILARDMVKRPGEFLTVVRRKNGVVVRSLAITTLAAMLHPETRLELDWKERNRWMSALYEIEPGAYLRAHDRIEFTKVFKQQRGSPLNSADDILACNTFKLDRPQLWEKRTVPYETLLNSSHEELRRLAENKLIVFGDLRHSKYGFRADRHAVKYGTTTIQQVPGCYLLADTIAGLLDQRYFKTAFPPIFTTLAFTMILAAIGCLLPIRLAMTRVFERPESRRAAWVALLSLTTCSLVVMVVSDHVTAVHAGMAGFALFAAMTGSFWVEFARNRYRIADRNRRQMESIPFSTGGTITLPLKRSMSLPGAR